MNSAFVDALADAAEEGAINLQELRGKCLAAIAAGQGEIAFTSAAGLNGKTAAQECRMDPTQLLGAVNSALRASRGQSVGATYADFSDLWKQ